MPAEAERVSFGVYLHGTGAAHVDTVTLETVGEVAEASATGSVARRTYDFEERQLEH